MVQALRYSAVIQMVARGSTLDKSESEREDFNARWAIFDKLDNEFNEIKWLARAQLGDAEYEALEALWKCKCRLWANQLTYLQAKSMFPHAFGDKAAEGLSDMVEKVQLGLQPHIRMEASKQSK